MWKDIDECFSSSKRKEIATLFLILGLSCKDDNKVYCQDIEVPIKKIADSMGIDRRVVHGTVKDILAHERLRQVFKGLKPRAFLRDSAAALNWGVIEIEASSETVGIVAGVSTLIAGEGISIRQVVADDPNLFSQPKLTIVTEQKIPPHLYEKILDVEGVVKVSIY